MKRGRPSKRFPIQSLILEVLREGKVPMSVLSITKKISEKTNSNVSWNTVKKYLDELVRLDKVRSITLPHSKIEGKDGLTIYTLKK